MYAVACTAEPAAPGAHDVRPVTTFEEFATSIDVMWEAFDTPEERRARQRPHLRAMFESQAAGAVRSFLAFADGRPAGVGRSIYSQRGVFLIAGAVAPWARKRGVYRALVRAR